MVQDGDLWQVADMLQASEREDEATREKLELLYSHLDRRGHWQEFMV